MKLSTFFYIILILFISCSYELSKMNDLERMNLFGQVKSIKSNSSKVVERNGKITKIPFEKNNPVIYIDNHFVFERNGNIIEQSNFRNGKLYTKNYLKKDDSLNLTEKKTFNSENKMTEKLSYEYLYDNFGKMKNVKKFNFQGDLITNSNYKYLSSGLIITSINFNQDGQETGKWIKEYDNQGNIIENVKYFSHGNTLRVTFKYDNHGNMIERNKYNLDGELREKSIYVYNKKGLKIEENQLEGNGELIDKALTKYDKYGNQIERTFFYIIGKSESKTSYKYQLFDKNNNWIKMITLEENIPTTVTVREIEYFK
jgi:hypothetical protein